MNTDEEITLPSIEDEDRLDTYVCHTGMMQAARTLVDTTSSPLYNKLKAALLEHPDFSLSFTGHSLGAGVAFCIALLLSRYDRASSTWVTTSSCGLPIGVPIRAYCFAPPALADSKLAARSRMGSPPLATSATLASDLVPRFAIPQLRKLRRQLGQLADRHSQHQTPSVFSLWRRWRKLSDQDLEFQEVVRQATALRELVEGNSLAQIDNATELLPPGRVLHIDRRPSGGEETGEAANDETDESDEQAWELWEVRDADRFFALPWLELSALASHMPALYLEAIESL